MILRNFYNALCNPGATPLSQLPIYNDGGVNTIGFSLNSIISSPGILNMILCSEPQNTAYTGYSVTDKINAINTSSTTTSIFGVEDNNVYFVQTFTWKNTSGAAVTAKSFVLATYIYQGGNYNTIILMYQNLVEPIVIEDGNTVAVTMKVVVGNQTVG